MTSLPSRKCGLKLNAQSMSGLGQCHFPRGSVDWNNVANCPLTNTGFVTSLAEVWIEIFVSVGETMLRTGHFPRGSVDWNRNGLKMKRKKKSHFPRGSVDWNVTLVIVRPLSDVTSLVEVWIEIYIYYRWYRNCSSHWQVAKRLRSWASSESGLRMSVLLN